MQEVMSEDMEEKDHAEVREIGNYFTSSEILADLVLGPSLLVSSFQILFFVV